MTTFKLEIDCDGAAFEPREAEVAAILRKLAESLDDGSDVEGLTLRDFNGNTVARAKFEDVA